jgi:hypothetical protein
VENGDAELEFNHLLNLLIITFVCAYLLGDYDITLENFVLGKTLLKIDPEIGSQNYPFTPKAIDPAWLLSHVSDRNKSGKIPTTQFFSSLLKFYSRVTSAFLDCLIALKENILDESLKVRRMIVISSMRSQIGEENVTFILGFLHYRERQFLKFLKGIKKQDYIFGMQFSEKFDELNRFKDHKDLQSNIVPDKDFTSIFSKLPFNDDIKVTVRPVVSAKELPNSISVTHNRNRKLARSVSVGSFFLYRKNPDVSGHNKFSTCDQNPRVILKL